MYTEETSKKTAKNEEKLAKLREIIQQKDEKLLSYELHVEKLSKQCFAFNELKLKSSQLVNEVDMLRSKIRFMEKNGGIQMGSSIGMSRMPSTTTQMNGANFGMEDEAGEEFNTQFLMDLKTGGSLMSLEKNDIYSAAELQRRNSMYPQHLRGSYAVIGMDRDISEQEIKAGNLSIITNSDSNRDNFLGRRNTI